MAATAVPTTNGQQQDVVGQHDSAGLGWLFFAGTMLGFAGLMRIVDSIWAFRYHGALPAGLQDATLGSNLKNYGWLFMIAGIVLLISSLLVLVGSQFARWVGLFAATIGGLSAIPWLPYFPVWSLVYIAMAVLVFYALVVHGGRQTA